MIQLVALSCRTDLIVLLCNRKDLIYTWVFKPLDCSSPKSMWFLWNIFSKGTHMLQCLCGKSLKKNKNPSGKLITIMPTPLFRCEPALCVRVWVCVDLRYSSVCCTGDRSAIIFMQRVDHAEALGGGTTYPVLCSYYQWAPGLETRSALTHKSSPASPRHHDLLTF